MKMSQEIVFNCKKDEEENIELKQCLWEASIPSQKPQTRNSFS